MRDQCRGLDPRVLLRVDGAQDALLDAGGVRGEAVSTHEDDSVFECGVRGVGVGVGVCFVIVTVTEAGGQGGAEVGVADEHVFGVGGEEVVCDVEDGGFCSWCCCKY